MREVSLEACDKAGYVGNLSFPHSGTDIHLTPMTNEDLWTYYQRWYEYAMAVQRVTMPAYGPLPMPSLQVPPVSTGCGEELSLGGPSVGVSEHHDCVTAFVGHETLDKKEPENMAKGMNENVEHCMKGGKMWSNVVKNAFENNERYGRERRDSYSFRRDDDRYDRYRGGRGGRGYTDSDRIRGGSRRARDYQDRGARYS